MLILFFLVVIASTCPEAPSDYFYDPTSGKYYLVQTWSNGQPDYHRNYWDAHSKCMSDQARIAKMSNISEFNDLWTALIKGKKILQECWYVDYSILQIKHIQVTWRSVYIYIYTPCPINGATFG